MFQWGSTSALGHSFTLHENAAWPEAWDVLLRTCRSLFARVELRSQDSREKARAQTLVPRIRRHSFPSLRDTILGVTPHHPATHQQTIIIHSVQPCDVVWLQVEYSPREQCGWMRILRSWSRDRMCEHSVWQRLYHQLGSSPTLEPSLYPGPISVERFEVNVEELLDVSQIYANMVEKGKEESQKQGLMGFHATLEAYAERLRADEQTATQSATDTATTVHTVEQSTTTKHGTSREQLMRLQVQERQLWTIYWKSHIDAESLWIGTQLLGPVPVRFTT
jgi:hypothetical protein